MFQHSLKTLPIVKSPSIIRVSTSRLPTIYGEFTVVAFLERTTGIEHTAIISGNLQDRHAEPITVRIHSECLTGDIFGSLRCDCGQQLSLSLDYIAKIGYGALLYLRGHEGRGIGLANKIHAYMLQDNGQDTVDANTILGLPVDSRSYDVAIAILYDLKIKSLKLLSNNPMKINALINAGITVVERLPLNININSENSYYLQTKKKRLGHIIKLDNIVT